MATKWTIEQEKVIWEEVDKNPENLREAFFIASLKINKTANAVCTRYYTKMINDDNDKQSKLKKLSDEVIALYEANLELKKQLEKWKKN